MLVTGDSPLKGWLWSYYKFFLLPKPSKPSVDQILMKVFDKSFSYRQSWSSFMTGQEGLRYWAKARLLVLSERFFVGLHYLYPVDLGQIRGKNGRGIYSRRKNYSRGHFGVTFKHLKKIFFINIHKINSILNKNIKKKLEIKYLTWHFKNFFFFAVFFADRRRWRRTIFSNEKYIF